MPSPVRAKDPAGIAQRIQVLRGQRVLLIADLAALYGVTARRLSEQVRRNRDRFPADFVFSIEINDIRNLMPQSAASSWGGRQFEEVYKAIRALMMPAAAKSRPIGFTADLDRDR